MNVLVLEREKRFKDRVRGDVMYPWGVAEARRLGVLAGALAGPARPLPYWRTRFHGLATPPPRDLADETGEPALAFFHPELQEALLGAAEGAGATVLRGARVTSVARAAEHAQVEAVQGGRRLTLQAPLVVGADGRGSAVRRWTGFDVKRDPPRLVFAGVVLGGVRVESTAVAADTGQLYFNPGAGLLAMLLPIDAHRTRAYTGYHLATGRRPEIGTDLGAFLALCRAAGADEASLAGAKQLGPLAAFDGADRWVAQPYEGRVALLGDAAAASDPSFGSGMALTLLSARLLANALAAVPVLDGEGVERAGRAYARAVAAAYGSLHRQTGWLTEFYRAPGPAADAARARLYPLHAAEPWRVPDVVGLGPAGPSDEAARRAFFGLDV